MASLKQQTRSLTPEEGEDEEAHPKKEIDLNKVPEDEPGSNQEIDLNKEAEPDEEYDRDRADLNKEAEHDDDAKPEEEADQDRIMASELAISEAEKKKMESEDKNANQENESSLPINRNRETMAMRTAPRRRLTPEEEQARAEQDDMVTAAFAISHFMFLRDTIQTENQSENKEAEHDDDVNQGEENEKTLASAVERKRDKKKKTESKDEDDSEQTLGLLSRWETPLNPPGKIVERRLIEKCSRPIRKQLTASDVSGGEQSRLALSKLQVEKKLGHLLEGSEILLGEEGGIRVSVYGPDGKVHEMKMWADEEKSPDLTTGWRKFVGDYELREICDFVTIWMFRHKETQHICLAIDSKRLSLRRQVSKRISMAAFEDSD